MSAKASTDETTNPIELGVGLATAWPGDPNTRCTPQEVHAFVRNSHATLVALSWPSQVAEEKESVAETQQFVPAVSARKAWRIPSTF